MFESYMYVLGTSVNIVNFFFRAVREKCSLTVRSRLAVGKMDRIGSIRCRAENNLTWDKRLVESNFKDTSEL